MAPYAKLVVVALQTVLHADRRDSVPVVSAPLTGVAFRPALVAFRTITFNPTVALLAIRGVLFLNLAMDDKPVGGQMILRYRFFRMASRTGVAGFLSVMALIAYGHRRLVPRRCLCVMHQVAMTIDALQSSQLGVRIMRNQQIA